MRDFECVAVAGESAPGRAAEAIVGGRVVVPGAGDVDLPRVRAPRTAGSWGRSGLEQDRALSGAPAGVRRGPAF